MKSNMTHQNKLKADALKPLIMQALNMQDTARHVMRQCGHSVDEWTAGTHDDATLELVCSACTAAALLDLSRKVDSGTFLVLSLPSGMCFWSATDQGRTPRDLSVSPTIDAPHGNQAAAAYSGEAQLNDVNASQQRGEGHANE